MTTTPPRQEPSPEAPSSARDSLSQVVARILDQLSPSAWLPAAALVAIGLVYGYLHYNDDRPKAAIQAIGRLDFPAIALLIGAVALLTMVIQAFEFELIRLLEGYWSNPVGALIGRVGCAFHWWRRQQIYDRIQHLNAHAYCYARERMISRGVSQKTIDRIETARRSQKDEDPRLPDWREHAPPHEIRRVHELVNRLLRAYPDKGYRILPTMLGNVMRVNEDRLHRIYGGLMEVIILRIYDSLPPALQVEHDRHRGRLELYCSLVVVFLLATAAAWPVLFLGKGQDPWKPPVIAIAANLSLAFLSYRAAIAAARGYQDVLGAVLDTKHVQEAASGGNGDDPDPIRPSPPS